MSNTVKIVIGVVVLLVLIVLAMNMGGGTPAGETDASDQALRDDAAAVDAEMQGLEGDRAMIDQGLETDVSAE